jgi:hypothetical protein
MNLHKVCIIPVRVFRLKTLELSMEEIRLEKFLAPEHDSSKAPLQEKW